jgi:hypothetical protein
MIIAAVVLAAIAKLIFALYDFMLYNYDWFQLKEDTLSLKYQDWKKYLNKLVGFEIIADTIFTLRCNSIDVWFASLFSSLVMLCVFFVAWPIAILYLIRYVFFSKRHKMKLLAEKLAG